MFSIFVQTRKFSGGRSQTLGGRDLECRERNAVGPVRFFDRFDILSNTINENPSPQDQITASLPLFAPLGIELGKKWDRVHPVVLEVMKEAAENVGMKTSVDIPPGKIHNGWVWMWPSTGNFRTDYTVSG